jgi:hypothetical protein
VCVCVCVCVRVCVCFKYFALVWSLSFSTGVAARQVFAAEHMCNNVMKTIKQGMKYSQQSYETH